MKHAKIGLALAAGLGGAWLVWEPDAGTRPSRADAEKAPRKAEHQTREATGRPRATALASAEMPGEDPARAPLLERVRDTVSRATAAFRDHLAANPSRLHEMCTRGASPEEYAAESAKIHAVMVATAGGEVGQVILPAPDPGCRRTYDDWLSGGVANVLLGSALTDTDAFARMQGDVEGREVEGTLSDLVARSEDEKERIAALILLQNAPHERSALPPAVYSGIGAKTPTEIQLLLDVHSSVPLPAQAIGEVRSLATDESQPLTVRKSALTALAHRRTASELAAVVDAVGSDPALLADMGPALAMCGTSCLGILEKLAASPDEGLRFVAYRAGLDARGDDRSAFRELIVRSQAVAMDLGAEEQELRRHLLRID